MQKVVIVTGAAGVLGGAIASAFGNAGDKVVISDINITPKAEELASAINRGKGEAFVRKTDIRDWEEVDGMVKETVKKWGRLDVIASVGGQSLGRLSKEGKDKLLLEHTVEDWDLVMETNLRGNFNCIKAAAGQMIQQKDGQIIIMGSGTANKGRVGASSYAAAKSGLYGLMRSAALELGGYNIKVNVVNPGRVMHRPEDKPEDYIIKENTLGRVSEASEVGDFFVYLSRMKNISGQIFNLDSRIIF